MWEALLVLAASAAAKYQNDRNAQKRQESMRNAMEQYQRTKARDVEAVTGDLLDKQTPKARETELASATADREQSLKNTVGAAQAFNAAPASGKLSADYKAVDEANAGRIAERTRRAIQQLAVMGAPSEAQRRFSTRFGHAAGEVDANNVASDRVGRAAMTDINNVRPNAAVDMLSQIGMAYGGASLGGAAGAAATTAGNQSVNNGQGYEDASGNMYSNNATRQQRVNRGFSLWGAR